MEMFLLYDVIEAFYIPMFLVLNFLNESFEATALAGPVFLLIFGEFYLSMWNISQLLVSFHYSVMSVVSLLPRVQHFSVSFIHLVAV